VRDVTYKKKEDDLVITLNPDTWRNEQSGVGVGYLSDDTKVRVMIGPTSATMTW
jgi:hypothetical protein